MSYESEAHLCDAFMSRARALGCRCYPEIKGDILVELPSHELVIVEAKLRPNLRVISQALTWLGMGADGVAVLVPKTTGEFLHVCGHSGLMVARTGPPYMRDDVEWNLFIGGRQNMR